MKVKTSIVKKNTKKNTKRVNKRKTLRRNYRTISKIGGGDFNINLAELDKYGIAYYKKYDRKEINKLKLPTQYIVSAEIIEQNSKLELKSGIVEPKTEDEYKNTYKSILNDEINNKTYVIDNLEEINDEHFVKDSSDVFEQCLNKDYHRSKLYFLNDVEDDFRPYYITENKKVTDENIEVSIKDFIINKFKSSNVNHTLISQILCQGLGAYVAKKILMDTTIGMPDAYNNVCTIGAATQFIFDKKNNKFIRQFVIHCKNIEDPSDTTYIVARTYIFCDLFIDEPTTDNKIYMSTIWDMTSYKKFLNEIWLKPEYKKDDKYMIIKNYVNAVNKKDITDNIDTITNIIKYITEQIDVVENYMLLIDIIYIIKDILFGLSSLIPKINNARKNINNISNKISVNIPKYIAYYINNKEKIQDICNIIDKINIIDDTNNIRLNHIIEYILQLDKEAIIYKDKLNLTPYNSLVTCVFIKINALNIRHSSIKQLQVILDKIRDRREINENNGFVLVNANVGGSVNKTISIKKTKTKTRNIKNV